MISHADLIRMQARTGKKIDVPKTGAEKESALHAEIIEYCKTKGISWFVVRSQYNKPSTNGAGVPDLIIAADGGKTYWIECKRAKGKLSQEQHTALHWLKILGHQAHCVTSLEQFKEIVE